MEFLKNNLKTIITEYSPQIIEYSFNTLSRDFVDICHDHHINVMLDLGFEGSEVFYRSLELDVDMVVLDCPVTFTEKTEKQGFYFG
jgi:hypothetical protein